jgi:transcriptional regulator with XRE-family HTH domain
MTQEALKRFLKNNLRLEVHHDLLEDDLSVKLKYKVEFASRLKVHPYTVAVWESGHKEPDGAELDALVKAELTLDLRGITTEKIDEREDRYNKQ